LSLLSHELSSFGDVLAIHSAHCTGASAVIFMVSDVVRLSVLGARRLYANLNWAPFRCEFMDQVNEIFSHLLCPGSNPVVVLDH